MFSYSLIRFVLKLALAILMTQVAWSVHAHSFKTGDITIDHPYALPSPAGMKNGAVYFRGMENQGKQADRLVSARSDVAERVELHHMQMDGSVMRMREVESVGLPPGKGVLFRHGQPNAYHLMLINLKAPLKEGDRFPIWLKFQYAGEKRVMVWVQNPRGTLNHLNHTH